MSHALAVREEFFMRVRQVSLSGAAPWLRLRISEPGRRVPPLEFEGPEVYLMMQSGCAEGLLPCCGDYRVDAHGVARIVLAVAAARRMLALSGAARSAG
jgi:hypothetical protein